MVDPKDLTYRVLAGNELSLLETVIRHRGWSELNYETSMAIAAFDGRKLVGFNVLQSFPHAEPMFVQPEYRGTGVAEELADRLLGFMREIKIRGFMVVADSEFAAKLCEGRGMELVTSPVYIMRKEMVQ